MSSSEIPPFDHSAGYKLTENPNPSWTWGDRIEKTAEGRAWADGEKEGWKVVDGAEEDARCVHCARNIITLELMDVPERCMPL